MTPRANVATINTSMTASRIVRRDDPYALGASVAGELPVGFLAMTQGPHDKSEKDLGADQRRGLRN